MNTTTTQAIEPITQEAAMPNRADKSCIVGSGLAVSPMHRVSTYFYTAFLTLLLDQAIKLGVHLTMEIGPLGQIPLLGNWFKLYYTLNPGMAFGIQFGFRYDKILLTLIRLVITVRIGQYIWQSAQSTGLFSWLLFGWALVLGGAASNGIDSIFYGVLLDNVPYQAPMSWFYGQVIDMFYLDIWSGQLPSWVPGLAGKYVIFFPIFNLADIAILGGMALIVYIRQYMPAEPASVPHYS